MQTQKSNAIVEIKSLAAALKENGASRNMLTRAIAEKLLFEHGIQPSANLVRSISETGSMTDISQDLKQFWQGVRDQRQAITSIDGVPDSVSDAYKDLMTHLWSEAMKSASAKFNEQRQEMEARFDEVKSAAESTRNTLDLLSITHSQMQIDYEDSKVQILDLNKHLAEMKQHYEKLVSEGEASNRKSESLRIETENELQQHVERSVHQVQGLNRDLREVRLQVDQERQRAKQMAERHLNESEQSNQMQQVLRQQINSMRDQHHAETSRMSAEMVRLSSELDSQVQWNLSKRDSNQGKSVKPKLLIQRRIIVQQQLRLRKQQSNGRA